jgi:hypothetical protein
MPPQKGRDLFRREWMLLKDERLGKKRKAKYAKLIEGLGGYYETQEEEEEVPFSGIPRARHETDQIEANRRQAQKEVNSRLGKLFEDLDLALPNEAADEDERKALYTVVASIFA